MPPVEDIRARRMPGFAQASPGKVRCFVGNDACLCQLLNHYDYLPTGLVPHLPNLTFDLAGVLPDAFGLDIGVAGGLELNAVWGRIPGLGSPSSAGLSGVGGINILWHTRGDSNAGWPEVHLYYGYSANAGRGSLNKRNSLLDATKFALAGNASGAAQLILGWARFLDEKGNSGPSSSRPVIN